MAALSLASRYQVSGYSDSAQVPATCVSAGADEGLPERSRRIGAWFFPGGMERPDVSVAQIPVIANQRNHRVGRTSARSEPPPPQATGTCHVPGPVAENQAVFQLRGIQTVRMLGISRLRSPPCTGRRDLHAPYAGFPGLPREQWTGSSSLRIRGSSESHS